MITSTPKTRLFFALIPDQHIRQQVSLIQQKLGNPGRAIPPEQFHITLAFLGMQSPNDIPVLKALAGQLDFPACTLRLDHLGRFGRAGVLWLGLSEIPPPLLAFHQTLTEKLESARIGFDKKEWRPHLTLYRGLRTRPEMMDPEAVIWQLNGFALMESVNVKNGVSYRCLERW